MASASRLFEPLKVGNLQLSHRIVMAPLTRFRADDDHIPTQMMVEYYRQRASVPGTLIITEATNIAPQAVGYPNAPGIWSNQQIDAWEKITEAVHMKKSFIFLQLWAVGRVASPRLAAERGFKVVSSSAAPIPGTLRLAVPESLPAVPHALSEDEIWEYTELYATAAKNAIAAGFDGVEIHGAGGYLIDQFTQDVCNDREDGWGGSIENRSRFGFEVANAVSTAIGAERTAFRLSPFNTVQGMGMRDVVPQFSHLASRLRELRLAYLHIIGSGRDTEGLMPTAKLGFLIELWSNTTPVFLNGGFQPDTAKRATDEQFPENDIAIVFGRLFISNPDLVFRIKKEMDLQAFDPTTFYLPKSERGYIDYNFSKEFTLEH